MEVRVYLLLNGDLLKDFNKGVTFFKNMTLMVDIEHRLKTERFSKAGCLLEGQYAGSSFV